VAEVAPEHAVEAAPEPVAEVAPEPVAEVAPEPVAEVTTETPDAGNTDESEVAAAETLDNEEASEVSIPKTESL
jgi:ribonuclease E